MATIPEEYADFDFGFSAVDDEEYKAKTTEVEQKIVEVVDPQATINYEDMLFEDVRNYKVSSASYRNSGWYPSFNLEDGITELASILKDGRIKDTSDAVYSNARYIKETVNA